MSQHKTVHRFASETKPYRHVRIQRCSECSAYRSLRYLVRPLAYSVFVLIGKSLTATPMQVSPNIHPDGSTGYVQLALTLALTEGHAA